MEAALRALADESRRTMLDTLTGGPATAGELAALLPNPRLKILAGCAHVPQLQAPRMFLDAIADFLKPAYATV